MVIVKLDMTAADYERNILEVINSIDVMDFSVASNEVEYILIDNTEANEIILDMITIVSQSDYDIRANSEGDYIDITSLGFEFANWWDINEGFQIR